MKSLLRATVEATRGVVAPLTARRNGVANATPGRSPAPAPAATPGPSRESYAAVAIRPCPQACEKAQALAHRRMLKDEAPESLPLPGCTNNGCKCRFEYFHDRRAEGERRDRGDDEEEAKDDSNRRLPGDRRINKQRARPTSYFNDHD